MIYCGPENITLLLFFEKLSRNESIFIIFGAQNNSEEVWRKWFRICTPLLKNFTAPSCEAKNSLPDRS